MKKVILVVCVLSLLLAATSGAFASATNWVIFLKASNTNYNNGGTATQMGINTVAGTPSTASWPTTSGAAVTAINNAGTYYSKQIRAAGGAQAWDLKVGARAEFPGEMLRLSLYNNVLDVVSRDTALDATKVVTLSNSTGVIAWFSTLEHANDNRAMGAEKWSNISALTQAKGWSPTAGMTGWFIDVNPTTGASFGGLADYSLSVTDYGAPIPEPGSLLALGSGLMGLVGFAVRRRKA